MVGVVHDQARAEAVKRLPGCHITGIAIRNPHAGGHYLIAFGTPAGSTERTLWILRRLPTPAAYTYELLHTTSEPDSEEVERWIRDHAWQHYAVGRERW